MNNLSAAVKAAIRCIMGKVKKQATDEYYTGNQGDNFLRDYQHNIHPSYMQLKDLSNCISEQSFLLVSEQIMCSKHSNATKLSDVYSSFFLAVRQRRIIYDNEAAHCIRSFRQMCEEAGPSTAAEMVNNIVASEAGSLNPAMPQTEWNREFRRVILSLCPRASEQLILLRMLRKTAAKTPEEGNTEPGGKWPTKWNNNGGTNNNGSSPYGKWNTNGGNNNGATNNGGTRGGAWNPNNKTAVRVAQPSELDGTGNAPGSTTSAFKCYCWNLNKGQQGSCTKIGTSSQTCNFRHERMTATEWEKCPIVAKDLAANPYPWA